MGLSLGFALYTATLQTQVDSWKVNYPHMFIKSIYSPCICHFMKRENFYLHSLFHHHHQICFIWLNREILFQAVIIFHWVLEEVCFVSTNPWPLKLQVGITLLRFNFSHKPNCTSSRFFLISIAENLSSLLSSQIPGKTALLRTLMTKIDSGFQRQYNLVCHQT